VTDGVQKLEQSRGARAGKLERPQRSGVQELERPAAGARAAGAGGTGRGRRRVQPAAATGGRNPSSVPRWRRGGK
jgi:hypothetical protein